ncbi:MAG: hypothetical protein ACFCU3_12305 [Verrucomicrobiales bacterium]
MSPLSNAISDALRYWEPRRVAYNGVLAAITVGHAITAVSDGRSIDWPLVLMWLFVLAVLANVLYCFAYFPDVLIQLSEFRDRWKKARIGLLLIGCGFAACFAWWTSSSIFSGLPM